MNINNIFFDKFHVARASYGYDFDRVIDEIPIGAEACFKREPDNAHDKNAKLKLMTIIQMTLSDSRMMVRWSMAGQDACLTPKLFRR